MRLDVGELLQELQVRRKFFIRLIGMQRNAGGALIRRALGFQWDADEKAREGVAKRAGRILAAELAGKDQREEDEEVATAIAGDLGKLREALQPLKRGRDEVELAMKRAVRKLPAYPWAKGVMGFGDLGLAVIIGEAGDLSKYPNPAKLWKRLGLAPLSKDGETKAASTWRKEGGLTAEDWTVAGYSPRRRAEMYAVVGEPLLKANKGPYRAAYDGRRARTAGTHPDWAPIRSHMDGMRIMTKQLVLDLWVEWRRATAVVSSIAELPAANTSADEAERPAIALMHPTAALPDALIAAG